MRIRTRANTNNRLIRNSQRAFTLIELLVVIALTVILMTVLFVPLITAFNFTSQAQATAEAQDAARSTTEELSRELGGAAAVRDTTGNFLDLALENKSGNTIIAHAYNSYIDIVPPKSIPGSIVDPTIDTNNATQTASSGGLAATGVALPLSSASTITRYFVGLRYPIDPKYKPGTWTWVPEPSGGYAGPPTTFTPAVGVAADASGSDTSPEDPQPYDNRYEHISAATTNADYQSYSVQQGLNNTYQLFRANVQPYILNTGSTGGYVPNYYLFPVVQSGAKEGQIVLDDPDFFRIVRSGDPNDPDWADDSTGQTLYTPLMAEEHNDRVYNWYKIAKTVISTRDIDLVGLTRAGARVSYDNNGNPVDAYESSVTTGLTNPNPIVRTTVNFAPGLIANDPMAATTASNNTQGYGATNINSTLPFVPSIYAAQYGNWQGNPSITIFKNNGIYLQSRTFTSADNLVGYTLASPNYSSAASPQVGDLILGNTTANPSTPVYDISLSAPIVVGAALPTDYDAVLLDKNKGMLTFSIPALPNNTGAGANPLNTYFQVTGAFNQFDGSPNANIIYLGDYGLLPNTPLSPPSTETAGTTSPSAVPNAVLVINSERVIGPNEAGGPIDQVPASDEVQYTRVSQNPPNGPNQYYVDYGNNEIVFSPNAIPPASSATPVQIAFSYQNNLTPNTTIGQPDNIDTVKSSYYTASIMRLNLGVRVYGPQNGASQYFSLDSQVGVGNIKAN